MLGKIIAAVFGLLGGSSAQSPLGTSWVSNVAALASIGGGALWLFGPGRELHWTFNLLEISAIALAGMIAGEILWRMKPPGP